MTATPPIQAPEDESSLLEILTVLLKRWRTVLGIPVTVAVLVLGISFLVSPTYTGTTSFVPEVRSEGGVSAGLAGIAGQLGISFGAEASQSPQFYAQVSKSREILTRLLLARYDDPRADKQPRDSTTLLIILGKGGRSHADSLERAIKHLGGRLSVGVDAQTNVVTLKAELPHPDLAAAVPNRLVAYLNDFNTQTRQSQARERRKFTEQRVAAGEQDLRASEEALKRFYQANRSWQQSPQLMFEEGQLKRQVDLRQELYRTLRREYETARIEEVNDTPVITVIDAAVPPQRKSGPKRRLWALVAFVLSGVFAVSWAFGAEYVVRARREEGGPYRDLVSTARQLRDGLNRTFGGLSRFAREPKKAPRDS
jgi:uncharacterized protein involved in exopolysaccharide biosynthesis